MWFRSLFRSFNHLSRRKTTRRAQLAADRRCESRRLFLESLEDRSLMAFDFLADYTTGANPVNVLLAPINSGSQLDLVVVNGSDNSISVQLGNADGTFGPPQTSSTGTSPRSLAAGDFNGDGAYDVATANSADVSLLSGNGDGTFAALGTILLPGQIVAANPDPGPLPQNPLSVATGDLNGDGKLDLVVGGYTSLSILLGCDDFGCSYDNFTDGYVNVLLGNGTGDFGPAEVHHLGSDRIPLTLAVGDINGDGNADVISANYGDLSVLLGDGIGAVSSPINSGSGSALPSISLGDVDGDGKVDTLLGSGGSLSVQKGDGLGSFAAQPPVLTDGYWAYSAVMGDVNADGNLDLVAVSTINEFTCDLYDEYGCISGHYTATRQATVLLGNGTGSFAAPRISSLGSATGTGWLVDVALADLTGDGRPELATIDNSLSDVIIATNDGDFDPLPTIAISDATTVVEGNSGTVSAVFTVTLVGAHSGSVSVNFATADNTAVANPDYAATAGTLTFGPGESTKTISVLVQGDTIDEFDEQFFVNLSSPVRGIINDAQGIGTIQDDDPAPVLTINDVSKNEGNSGSTSFVFTVTLSAVSGKDVYVNFATANGTATVADSDYVAKSGMLYIAPGQKTATFTVTVRGDKKKESNETFYVNLSSASNATLSDSQAMGTITNDDGGQGKGNGRRN